MLVSRDFLTDVPLPLRGLALAYGSRSIQGRTVLRQSPSGEIQPKGGWETLGGPSLSKRNRLTLPVNPHPWPPAYKTHGKAVNIPEHAVGTEGSGVGAGTGAQLGHRGADAAGSRRGRPDPCPVNTRRGLAPEGA